MEAYLVKLGQILEAIILYVERASFPVLLMHAAIFLVLYHVLRISIILTLMFFQRLRRKGVAEEKTIFSQSGPGSKRILVAGDSTAAGTGADGPWGTFTNMLARDFPKADISNVAVNGALTRDILKQFEKHKYLQQDVIIISTGGNDIWSLITMRTLRKDLAAVLDLAKAMSDGHVLVLFFGNAGSAPLFPYLVRRFLMSREKKALKVFADICKRERIQLIELFMDKNKNPFVENPKRYFSADGLHPSGNGYALWYEHIQRAIKENSYLS
jgi:lysophospholipase L1-like esterase